MRLFVSVFQLQKVWFQSLPISDMHGYHPDIDTGWIWMMDYLAKRQILTRLISVHWFNLLTRPNQRKIDLFSRHPGHWKEIYRLWRESSAESFFFSTSSIFRSFLTEILIFSFLPPSIFARHWGFRCVWKPISWTSICCGDGGFGHHGRSCRWRFCYKWWVLTVHVSVCVCVCEFDYVSD